MKLHGVILRKNVHHGFVSGGLRPKAETPPEPCELVKTLRVISNFPGFFARAKKAARLPPFVFY
ncbi:MAG: hypothetical protein V1735_01985 [Nanoarchaeota archaeon]